MTIGQFILQTLLDVLLFLIASYFLFYKSWLNALGAEVAKLSTAEELTRLTEGVKSEFSGQLENQKIKLSEELSHKIEPLKAELAKGNITHQVQLQFLHNKRGEVIVELYRKMIDLHSAMLDWTATFQEVIEDADKEKEARTTRVNKAMFEFNNFYLYNRLFFSEGFCKELDDVLKDFKSKGWDFGYRQSRVQDINLSKEYLIEYGKEMSKINAEIRGTLSNKIEAVEKRMRQLLNVEVDEQSGQELI